MKKNIFTIIIAFLLFIQIDVTTSREHVFFIKDAEVKYPLCVSNKTQTNIFLNRQTSSIKDIVLARIINQQGNYTISKTPVSLFPSCERVHISKYNSFITRIIKLYVHQDDVIKQTKILLHKTPIASSDKEEASLIS